MAPATTNKEAGRAILSLLEASKFQQVIDLVDQEEPTPDLTITDKAGNGSLHLLAKNAFNFTSNPPSTLPTELATLLLAKGVDPTARNRHAQTPLHLLLLGNPEDIAPLTSLLVNAGVNINARDANDRTFLSNLLLNRPDGGPALHQIPLTLGADPNARDARGRSLLHEIVHEGYQPVEPRLSFLVNAGADPRCVDGEGNSLFHEAVTGPCACDLETLEALLRVGVDVEQANGAGRTPLHLFCSLGHDAVIGEETGTECWDWILTRAKKSVAAADRDGNTPLHFASMVSGYMVDKLLEAGADIVDVANVDGLTPVHLAVRGRQSNIVGRLLETSTKSLGARDRTGRTPLHHACRSGRPETVALLLDAGADPSLTDYQGVTALAACLEFEDERKLWEGYRRLNKREEEALAEFGSQIFVVPDSEFGATLEDPGRPFVRSGKAIRQYAGEDLPMTINTDHDTAKIDEILDMIVAWSERIGKGTNWIADVLRNGLDKIKGRGLEYMTGCFRRILSRITPGEAVSERNKPQDINESFELLLRKCEYTKVETLFHKGINFFEPDYSRHRETKLHILAKFGYANLLEKIGTLEAESQFNNGKKWHAAGDPDRPGLGDCTDPDSIKSLDPFLLSACRSELPNMQVIRVLVEKLHVNPNAQDALRHEIDEYEERKTVGRDTALHELARGMHWWQVALAIPYLCSPTTPFSTPLDLNARNWEGSTPLRTALESNGPYAERAARALIEAGADVNSVDSWGSSILAASASSKNLDLVELLLSKGAIPTVADLMAAIGRGRQDLLERFLAVAGADPNGRMTDRNNGRQLEDEVDLAADSERYDFVSFEAEAPLLYRTASFQLPNIGRTEKRRETTAEFMRIILAHGADPYAEYRHGVEPRDPAWPSSPIDEDEKDVQARTPTEVGEEVPGDDEGITVAIHEANPKKEKEVSLGGFWGDGDDDDDDNHDEEEDDGNDSNDNVEEEEYDYDNDNDSENSSLSVVSVPDFSLPAGTRSYARRCVANAILEDGFIGQPLFELPNLDTEQHDPAGRTLLLSACRSALGADRALPGTSESKITVVETLLSRGSNPFATDNAGKNALHHLLESHDAQGGQPPVIRRTLQLFLQKYSSVVDQADRNGDYPLHAALRRRMRYLSVTGSSSEYVHDDLNGLIDDLLAAVADVTVCDGRGNTALHYLAAKQASLGGEEQQRRLFREFVARGTTKGVNLVSVRNDTGKSALDVAVARGNQVVVRLFDTQGLYKG